MLHQVQAQHLHMFDIFFFLMIYAFFLGKKRVKYSLNLGSLLNQFLKFLNSHLHH